MKTLKILTVLVIFTCITHASFSQKRHHRHPHRHPHKKVVVVKRSPYRPKKVVVFHPVWRPKYAYARRWVFFPKYNLYWDNWRNHYFFWNGVIWVSQPSPPPVIVNVNLENEKHYELKEDDDDNDTIGNSNDTHKSEYKAD